MITGRLSCAIPEGVEVRLAGVEGPEAGVDEGAAAVAGEEGRAAGVGWGAVAAAAH